MVCLVTQMTVMQLLKGRYSETVHFWCVSFYPGMWIFKIRYLCLSQCYCKGSKWKESWKNVGTFYLPYFRLRKNEYLFLGTHLAEDFLHVNVTKHWIMSLSELWELQSRVNVTLIIYVLKLVHFLLYLKGDSVWRSGASYIVDHFLYSHDLWIWLKDDTVRRN